MPITFQPAAPFSPNISEQYGQTEQFTRLAPLLEQHQQAVAQAYAQQRHDALNFASANADRMQQGSQFAAAQDQHRQLQDAQLGQQAAQADAQRQQQQTAHEQQIQAQLDMQRNEFTYKDQLELQRYKNGLSEIENSPNLTPEERADMRVQFATKIDPMERKLAQSRMQMQQQQVQQMQQHMATQDIIAKDRAAFMAGSLDATTKTIMDEDGNPLQKVTIIPGHEDKPIVTDMVKVREMKAAAQERAAAVVEAAQVKADAALEKGKRMHEEAMMNYQHKLGMASAQFVKEVTHEVHADQKAGLLDNVDVEGRINTLAQRRLEAYERKNPPPKPPAGAGGTSQEPDFVADSKPFQYTRPETQSVQQRQAVKDILDPVDSVISSAAPKDVKEQAFVASQQAGALLGQFGSAAAMRAKDPAKHAQFMQSLADIQAALNKSRESQAAAPPPEPTQPAEPTPTRPLWAAARGASDHLVGPHPQPQPVPDAPAQPAAPTRPLGAAARGAFDRLVGVRRDPRVIQRLGSKADQMTDQELAQWLATQR